MRGLSFFGVLCLGAVTVSLHGGAEICDCADPAPGSEITLELVTIGALSPVDLQAPTGDCERIFVVERRGTIRILDLATDTLHSEFFLDIQTRVTAGGERGLLGLAFHPDYGDAAGDKNYFFVNYTGRNAQGQSATIVARYETSRDEPNTALFDSEVRLLEIRQPASNHNAGTLAFGPSDGFLYIPMGDGGSGCDSAARSGQDPAQLLGKILRIDVDNLNLSAEPPEPIYGIPADNPFLGDGDVRDEIWALGLRNPWRFSFDAETGDMYVGDVGQNQREEVDFQPASSAGGENYGWNIREGFDSSSVSGCSASPLGPGTLTDPIFAYNHGGGRSRGCSITGGYVYRGCRIPALNGAYFFADYCSNWISSFRYDPITKSIEDQTDHTNELNAGLVNNFGSVSSFGTDASGELYVVSIGGRIYRIVPVIPTEFVRGDANADHRFDIADPLFTVDVLFGGELPATATCDDAQDSNDDGDINIADPVYSFNRLFARGPPIPAPSAECGVDLTEDDLECEASNCP